MMNRFKTENAPIAADMPRQTRKMSAQEIVKYMQEHFKSEFTTDEQGRMKGEKPSNKSTAYLMAVSKAIFDPIDWRNPIYAVMPQCGTEWAKAAIIWYHGAKPMESFVGVYSNGYDCW